MTFRIHLALAGALVALAGSASAAPAAPSQDRVQAVAARMAAGESYDQAIRSSQPPSAPTSARQVALGESYERATPAPDARRPESLEAVNTRWAKHLGAMNALGSHEAGWAASTGD